MPGIEAMIREAEKSLGITGRPNSITRPYSARNGAGFARAAWCNMAITEWARRSGNHNVVCFSTDYAYTVWHAQRFQRAGRWTTDVRGIRRGDIVFFDWGGSNSVGAIDHVGIVTKVAGGTVYTIEGNTSDRCARRVRSAATIVGYGRPDYSNASSASGGDDMRGLKQGDEGQAVEELQVSLRHAGFGDLLGTSGPNKDGVDDEYGPKTTKAVLACRKWVGSGASSGKSISGAAAAQIRRAVARREAERAVKAAKK